MTNAFNRVIVISALAGIALPTHAQVVRPPVHEPPSDDHGIVLPTPPFEDVTIGVDSGDVFADPAGGDGQVVFVAMVHVTDAPWLRLRFDTATLSGDPANDNTSRLRVVSVLDGGTQYLTSENVEQWEHTSAYFNGDAVIIELIASPGTGPSRLVMTSVKAGIQPFSDRTICGPTDDRVLSYDDRNARHSVGCSSWVINDLNSMFMTAGHCGTTGSHVMSFKVPLSTSSGAKVNPPPEHQYAVNAASVQGQNNGVGQDWGYFGVSVNSNTGLTPYQAYGVRHTLATSIPGITGSNIRITGYGTTSAPVPNEWNQVQKTHVGPLRTNSGNSLGYHTDTTGGNSGSCVLYENANTAVGVHTHGGCGSSSSSYNNGTKITYAPIQSALANPLGVCLSGKGVPGGILFASGDAANNFGTVSPSTGAFAKVGEIPGISQGMAWDKNRGLFYVIDNARNLYTVTPSGDRQWLGTVTGTTSILNGLAFDHISRTLYGLAGSNGQLFTINRDTLTVTPVGSAQGGNIGGLEIDSSTGTLYGLSDSLILGTQLVIINKTTGSRTTVGSLATGVNDCNGLAYVESEGVFYTINAANEQTLRIGKSTGAATVVGSTNGLFGASYALSAANPKECPADFDNSGFVDLEDFTLFVMFFESGTIDADIDGSGFVDLEDYDAFITAYVDGC